MLADRLKQPVVVENRAGASGSIAAAQVAKSPADGYTLMMLATPTLLAPHLYKKAGYDTARDYTLSRIQFDKPLASFQLIQTSKTSSASSLAAGQKPHKPGGPTLPDANKAKSYFF